MAIFRCENAAKIGKKKVKEIFFLVITLGQKWTHRVHNAIVVHSQNTVWFFDHF
jgi:hypothetical protein